MNDTLLFRHLPPELTKDEKEDFLHQFGAINVKTIESHSKRNCITFARFPSAGAAKIALNRLHQQEIMGYYLTVEFARGLADFNEYSKENKLLTPTKSKEDRKQKSYELFLKKLNSWNSSLNIMQPPPVHLKYQYPPPNEIVFQNICKCLASVPKFYTQVLHLMNRMNLPVPFETTFPEVNVGKSQTHTKSVVDVSVQVNDSDDEFKSSGEEESELETDNEEVKKDIVPLKRKLSQNKKTRIKKAKFVKPTIITPKKNKQKTKPEDVFEKPETEITQKKIEVIVEGKQILQDVSDQSVGDVGKFGLIFPTDKEDEKQEKEDEKQEKEGSVPEEQTIEEGNTITDAELAANRISSKDQKHLPVFKNYQPGIPSCRLYIKNLSKSVMAKDLHFIYRKYLVSDCQEQGTMFDVRLMQEGRMKGQAFVTLQSIQLAQQALKETNGYILKEKPMVVQFARSSNVK